MAMVNIIEMMGESMMGDDMKVKCMDMEYLYGRMEKNIQEIIIWIKKKDKGHFNGRMEENMKGNGKMESKMEGGAILEKIKLKNLEFGLKLFFFYFFFSG